MLQREPDLAGSYQYFLNDELSEIEERWQVWETGQSQRICSTRRAPGVALSVDAVAQRGVVREFEVMWRPAKGAEIVASYRLAAGGFTYSRHVAGAVDEAGEGIEQPVVFYPLMRIFTGRVIQTVAHSGGEALVIVPSVSGGDASPPLLAPDPDMRRVSRCEELNWPEPGPTPERLSRWQFMGGQYDANARFWLDERGLLVRYQWQQGADQHWDVLMVEDQ